MGESRKSLEESLQSVIIDQHLWPRHTKKVCRTSRLASCCPVLVSDIISPAKQAGRCNNNNRFFISVTYFHITWSIINYWNKTAVLSGAAGLNRVGISLIFVTKSREKYSTQILFSFSQQQLKIKMPLLSVKLAHFWHTQTVCSNEAKETNPGGVRNNFFLILQWWHLTSELSQNILIWCSSHLHLLLSLQRNSYSI